MTLREFKRKLRRQAFSRNSWYVPRWWLYSLWWKVVRKVEVHFALRTLVAINLAWWEETKRQSLSNERSHPFRRQQSQAEENVCSWFLSCHINCDAKDSASSEGLRLGWQNERDWMWYAAFLSVMSLVSFEKVRLRWDGICSDTAKVVKDISSSSILSSFL